MLVEIQMKKIFKLKQAAKIKSMQWNSTIEKISKKSYFCKQILIFGWFEKKMVYENFYSIEFN